MVSMLWLPITNQAKKSEIQGKLRARVEAEAESQKVQAQAIEIPSISGIEAFEGDFVKNTLTTAVNEGWTKTRTVEELRKAKEQGMTIKKAKELVKSAFDLKHEPIAIKA